jgi:hypothetical protein
MQLDDVWAVERDASSSSIYDHPIQTIAWPGLAWPGLHAQQRGKQLRVEQLRFWTGVCHVEAV